MVNNFALSHVTSLVRAESSVTRILIMPAHSMITGCRWLIHILHLFNIALFMMLYLVKTNQNQATLTLHGACDGGEASPYQHQQRSFLDFAKERAKRESLEREKNWWEWLPSTSLLTVASAPPPSLFGSRRMCPRGLGFFTQCPCAPDSPVPLRSLPFSLGSIDFFFPWFLGVLMVVFSECRDLCFLQQWHQGGFEYRGGWRSLESPRYGASALFIGMWFCCLVFTKWSRRRNGRKGLTHSGSRVWRETERLVGSILRVYMHDVCMLF